MPSLTLQQASAQGVFGLWSRSYLVRWVLLPRSKLPPGPSCAAQGHKLKVRPWDGPAETPAGSFPEHAGSCHTRKAPLPQQEVLVALTSAWALRTPPRIGSPAGCLFLWGQCSGAKQTQEAHGQPAPWRLRGRGHA